MIINLENTINRLECATIASCTCSSENPGLDFHDNTCRFRLIQKSINELKNDLIIRLLNARGKTIHLDNDCWAIYDYDEETDENISIIQYNEYCNDDLIIALAYIAGLDIEKV